MYVYIIFSRKKDIPFWHLILIVIGIILNVAQDWPRPLQELSENCGTSFLARLLPTLSSAATTCNWIGFWLIPSKYTARLPFLPLG